MILLMIIAVFFFVKILIYFKGGGCISIGGDGGLRQWQINNKVAHDAHVPNSFFAIKLVTNLHSLYHRTF